MPSSRCRASWTSASVGAVRSVAKVEHLLHYLPHRRERVQLAALPLVEQPPQLGVVRHGPLEVRLRTAGRDREHLAGEILPPPRLELAVLVEVCAVRLDLLPQFRDVLAAGRLAQDRSEER